MKTYQFRIQITTPKLIQTFSIPEGVTIVGRDPEVNLVLLDPLISRRHAQITCQKEQCLLTDLGSANGTFINGLRLAPNLPAPLINGALLRFGQVESQFTAEESIEAEQGVAAEAEVPIEQFPIEVSQAVPPPSDLAGGAPPISPPPEIPARENFPPGELPIPPGLSLHSQRLLEYLPGIYHSDFMARFLGIFESILTPIEWNIDNFDVFLDPQTSPRFFLDWLANWYQITFDSTWREDQRRLLLSEAHELFSRRGTRWALARMLEIYTGAAPEIIDAAADLEPYTFKVRIPLSEGQVSRDLVTRLINLHKPAYTTFSLEFL